MWGDSSLWYIIADANGLKANATLVENQELIIPNVATNIHNNAGTVVPYNPAEIIGDTNPTLPKPPPPPPPPPPPKPSKCAQITSVITVVVIAAIVTYVTAGAMSQFVGAWAGGVIGAAAGSMASQVAAIGLGLQEEFSWEAVAIAAVSAGATQGIAAKIDFGTIGNAVVGNAVNQGASMAFGEQEKFDWRSVAVSAIAAPISQSIGANKSAPESGLASNSTSLNGATLEGLGGDLISGFAEGVFTETLRTVIYKDHKFNWTSVASEAVSGALVDALDAEVTQNERQQALLRSLEVIDDHDPEDIWLDEFYDEQGNIDALRELSQSSSQDKLGTNGPTSLTPIEGKHGYYKDQDGKIVRVGDNNLAANGATGNVSLVRELDSGEEIILPNGRRVTAHGYNRGNTEGLPGVFVTEGEDGVRNYSNIGKKADFRAEDTQSADTKKRNPFEPVNPDDIGKDAFIGAEGHINIGGTEFSFDSQSGFKITNKTGYVTIDTSSDVGIDAGIISVTENLDNGERKVQINGGIVGGSINNQFDIETQIGVGLPRILKNDHVDGGFRLKAAANPVREVIEIPTIWDAIESNQAGKYDTYENFPELFDEQNRLKIPK